MGREVKRVPLDFNHTLGEPWPGYLSPAPRPCPAGDRCINGSTPDRAWLNNWVHILLVAAGNPTHPWVMEVPLVERHPTGLLADVTGALAGRRPDRPFGHDAIDRWKAIKAIIAAAGLPEDWGLCPSCQGLAYHPDDEGVQEAWERTEPPTGEGWQVWETVSEGSPVTPVFDSAEALARHLSTEGAWGHVYPYDVALRFVEAGWAPTGMASAATGFVDGVTAVGQRT